MRLSIRYKVLFVITALLIVALGSYLALATTLFTRDKLAYVYDLNASLVETLSEETRSSMTVLARTLAAFNRDVSPTHLTAAQADALARELFAVEPDLVRVEVLEGPASGPFQRRRHAMHEALAGELGLRQEDLEGLRRKWPLPVEAIAAEPGRLYVHNSSLPPDAALLTVAMALPQEGRLAVVAADFRPDRLLRIFGRSKLHETYLVDERGEVLAHPSASVVLQHADFSKHVLVREALEGAADRGVRELSLEGGQEFLGAYARVGVGRLTVLTQLPKDQALSASRELLRQSTLFGVAVLLLAMVASIFFSRLLTGPLRRLRSATDALARGQYDVDLDVRSHDEIGDLAADFGHMVAALRDARAQLVQSGKMAAFGQLGAGLTHEIKNPMTGIISFAQLAQRKLDDPKKLGEMLKLIETEGLRCKEILVNFLKFARGETAETGLLDVNQVVQSSGKLFGHQLGMNGVKLQMKLADRLAPVVGNENQLQQVLLNLAINAQQAMPGKGQVEITTRQQDGFVEIAFADDGPGIPKELQERVFEPFFTTKKPGEGSGLGLSICRRILEDHGGTMTLQSGDGAGACFVMRLPAANDAPPVGARGLT